MKKLFALLLSFLMLFTLTACEEEDVDLALDIAWAVLEELEKFSPGDTMNLGIYRPENDKVYYVDVILMEAQS